MHPLNEHLGAVSARKKGRSTSWALLGVLSGRSWGRVDVANKNDDNDDDDDDDDDDGNDYGVQYCPMGYFRIICLRKPVASTAAGSHAYPCSRKCSPMGGPQSATHRAESFLLLLITSTCASLMCSFRVPE